MAAIGTGYGRTDRYTRVAIGLHWTIATLILVNLAIGLFADALKGVPLMPVHKAIGLTVLALSVVRLGWRLTHPAPPLPATVPGWQRATAHVTHFLLYALMILLPLSGWWMVSASAQRRPLDWFGLFPLPYLPVQAGGGIAHDAHGLLGWTMLALVILHIGGALKHHWIDRDSVLARMAPVRAPR
jgi:cytochrome b561